MRKQIKYAIIFIVFLGLFSSICAKTPGSKLVSSHGYENCIEISNAVCRVVLEPNMGGRVLVYEIEGKNVLYIDSTQNGLVPNPETWSTLELQPCAGRFDIGPEKIKPNTELFWFGKWSGEITGKFSAMLTSQIDKKTNIQLVRSFHLNPKTSELKVTQTIKNLGNEPQKLCFWSRSFVTGGGICIVPLSNPNRFPIGYLSYARGGLIQYMPEKEDNIKVVDNHFLLLGPGKSYKFVFDTDKGWMGYITKNDMLFVKTYSYRKSYEYGEMAAVPLSVFYKEELLAELEPIGPWEWIKPKGESSFSETWHLLPFKYPNNKEVVIKDITAKVKVLE